MDSHCIDQVNTFIESFVKPRIEQRGFCEIYSEVVFRQSIPRNISPSTHRHTLEEVHAYIRRQGFNVTTKPYKPSGAVGSSYTVEMTIITE